MKTGIIKTTILIAAGVFGCVINVPKITAYDIIPQPPGLNDPEFYKKSLEFAKSNLKKISELSKTNTDSDKYLDYLKSYLQVYKKFEYNSLMKVSRKLNTEEINQISNLPNSFGLNEYNVRIIDYESVLNAFNEELGKGRVEYYKALATDANNQAWTHELQMFFLNTEELLKKLEEKEANKNKYKPEPGKAKDDSALDQQEYQAPSVAKDSKSSKSSKDYSGIPDSILKTTEGTVTFSKEDKSNPNKYSIRIKCIKQMMEEINSDRIKNNDVLRQHFVTFLAINKLRSELDENYKLNFIFSDNPSALVTKSKTDINLNHSDIYCDRMLTYPEFSDNSQLNIFLGLSPFTSYFSAMPHEFGHAWYVYLIQSFCGKSYAKHIDKLRKCFHGLKSSTFLKNMFPIVDNFVGDDMLNVISSLKTSNNSSKSLCYWCKNIWAESNLSTEDINIFINKNPYDCRDILNTMCYNYIFGSSAEMAQVLGLATAKNESRETIIFVNRLSDFDYDVYNDYPFRAVYAVNNPNHCIKDATMTDKKIKKIKNFVDNFKNDLENQKTIKKQGQVGKYFHRYTLLRIKELRDQGIETIIPSENAMKMFFALHGKDLDDYRKKRNEIKNAEAEKTE